jgi:hypothetical protein
MRRKVGTALDASLYERAKEAARRQGMSTNALIEEALKRFLRAGRTGASAVAETRATYRVSAKALKAVLHEGLYGPD